MLTGRRVSESVRKQGRCLFSPPLTARYHSRRPFQYEIRQLHISIRPYANEKSPFLQINPSNPLFRCGHAAVRPPHVPSLSGAFKPFMPRSCHLHSRPKGLTHQHPHRLSNPTKRPNCLESRSIFPVLADSNASLASKLRFRFLKRKWTEAEALFIHLLHRLRRFGFTTLSITFFLNESPTSQERIFCGWDL